MMIRAVSYGGGVQSTALLVLAAMRKIDFPTFLFCNVGDDSENPATIAYVHDVAMPYAQEHGIELVELHRTRFGQPETLYARLMRPSRTIDIPMRMEGSGAPGNRTCTGDFKIKVVARWLKEHGATEEQPAILGMGISLDEFQRMRSESGFAYEKLEYPLIDLRLTRQDCVRIIEKAGIPVPPKSSCFFCPFKSMRQWQELRQEEPTLFQKSCDLEQTLNERRKELGRDAMWLTPKLKPLAKATTELTQESLFEDEMCDSGYCMI